MERSHRSGKRRAVAALVLAALPFLGGCGWHHCPTDTSVYVTAGC